MFGRMAETKKISSSKENNFIKLIYRLIGLTLGTNQPKFPTWSLKYYGFSRIFSFFENYLEI
jgi:hypothetical protein